MPRTLEEIADHIRNTKDFFGVTAGDLKPYLPFRLYERAGLKLAEGSTEADINQDVKSLTDEVLRAEILGYLYFAWEKCNDKRGLSVCRSIDHFRAWTFALGDEEAYAFLQDEKNFPMYGRPMLEFLSKRFGYSENNHSPKCIELRQNNPASTSEDDCPDASCPWSK
jgi:hypothetical protein